MNAFNSDDQHLTSYARISKTFLSEFIIWSTCSLVLYNWGNIPIQRRSSFQHAALSTIGFRICKL